MEGSREPIVSIRLPEEEVRALLQRIEEEETVPLEQRRRHGRHRFHRLGVILTVEQQGYKSTFRIPLRNLSRTGLAFLHRSMMHKGSACTAHIPAASGGWVQVRGCVARCRHVKGLVYEIGLRLDYEVDVEEILGGPLPAAPARRTVKR